MPGRTIAIGDIHGCSLALAALLEVIAPGPGDTLVPLGDSIDRGPDSRGVLEQLLCLHRRCILVPLLGNHEEMLLKARSGGWSHAIWLAFGGKETLAAYGLDAGLDIIPREHWAFLESCRKVHESLKCIDTYCHDGGWLTALEVHTGQVWQANERGELRR